MVNKQLIVELEKNIQKNIELDEKLRDLESQLEAYRKMEDVQLKAIKTGSKFYNINTEDKALKTGSKFYQTNNGFGKEIKVFFLLIYDRNIWQTH